MTQDYLCGEVAARLALLEQTAANETAAREVRELRRETETATPRKLRGIARRALKLADALCWDALEGGRTATFTEQATLAADLHEFAVVAQLLDD